MVDVSKIAYKIYLLRETGEQLNITDASTNVGWEENEGELAQRVSLTLANIMHKGQRLSSIAKPNCYIIVKAEIGGTEDEVARGKIVEWTPSRSGSTDDVALMGYDELYDLQASQDNRYVSAGVSTKTVMTGIFNDWGIPVDKYEGPENANAKTTFKNEYLSDILLELLETAHKHGARDCIIRAKNGKVSVLPKGGNTTIYCFEEEQNLELTKYKISTGEMVTVVKVVATEDEDKRQAVEAIINGKTEYGKRQKIYVRDDDDTMATATAAAKEILDEEGNPKETITAKAPDIPAIRKGDKIKITTRFYSGYALVLSVSHNASSRSMSMELAKFDPAAASKDTSQKAEAAPAKKEFKTGDIVNFSGGYHYYTSMDSDPRGGLRTGGKAWIQNVNKNGKHKYALIGGAYKSGVGGNSNVYGWVDEGTVS
jgi:hypothetical protein